MTQRMAAALVRHLGALHTARTVTLFTDAAFQLLHAAVDTDCASIFYRSAGDRMLLERDSLGREFDAAFTARHAELTPAIRLGMSNPGVKLLPTRTGLPLPDDELRRTALYREVMQVQGWRHAVALCFWDDPPASFPVLVFSVKRREGEPDFSDDDLAALEMMHGFIEPAVMRMKELASTNAVRDAMSNPLRHQARGTMVLDARLRVVHANPAARRICRRRSEGGAARTRSRTPVVPALVLAACRQLDADRPRLLREAPAAPVIRRTRHLPVFGVPPLAAAVTMICREVSGVIEPSFVIELDEGSDQDSSPLTFPPGLTDAEQAVAAALADGLSNQEIADRLGKTVHGVKFLLHSIYAKTGIGNRARLAVVLRGWAAP
jgi:DNA-binding CsgD family transcriptional regulator